MLQNTGPDHKTGPIDFLGSVRYLVGRSEGNGHLNTQPKDTYNSELWLRAEQSSAVAIVSFIIAKALTFVFSGGGFTLRSIRGFEEIGFRSTFNVAGARLLEYESSFVSFDNVSWRIRVMGREVVGVVLWRIIRSLE